MYLPGLVPQHSFEQLNSLGLFLFQMCWVGVLVPLRGQGSRLTLRLRRCALSAGWLIALEAEKLALAIYLLKKFWAWQ